MDTKIHFADEGIGEIANTLEVIDTIAEFKGFKEDEIAVKKQKKAEITGKIAKSIILDES